MHGLSHLPTEAAENRRRKVPPLPLLPLQPLLYRIVRRVAARHPGLFARLGRHRHSDFVIDVIDLPFALHLRPNPAALVLRAVPCHRLPPHDARISGDFRTLLGLIDAEEDGDAIFFSRDLQISGDTEAIVTLRNALDDVEGSVAEDVAGMFGAPGRLVLNRLRQASMEGTNPREDA